jgi:hypothetical protein
MEQIKRAGTSLVFVSHNLAAIRRLCDRLVVLHEGRVRHDGDTATGGAVLHELLETQHSTDDTAPLLDIATCQLTDGGGRAVRVVPTGGEVRFAVTARLRETTPEIVVGALIYDEQGVYVFGETRRLPTETVQMGEQVSFEVSFLAELVGGTYSARLFFASANGASVTWVSQPLAVDGRADVEGIADLHARFSLRHGLDADGDPGPAQQAASTD